MLILFSMIRLMHLELPRPSPFISNNSRLISGEIQLICLLLSNYNNLRDTYRMYIRNQLDICLHNLQDTWDNLRPPMASPQGSIPIIRISNPLPPVFNLHQPHLVLLNKPACRTILMLNHSQNRYNRCQQAPTTLLPNLVQTSLPRLPNNNAHPSPPPSQPSTNNVNQALPLNNPLSPNPQVHPLRSPHHKSRNQQPTKINSITSLLKETQLAKILSGILENSVYLRISTVPGGL